MLAYIIRRLLLVIPTLLGIITINFVIVQFAPGGPVEQAIAQIQGTSVEATARVSGSSQGETTVQPQKPGGGGSTAASKYRGARGLDPELIREIEKLYGFDLGNFRKIIRIHPHNMILNVFVADFNPMIFDFIQSDLFTWKIPYDFKKFSSIYGNYSLGFNGGWIRAFKSCFKVSCRNGNTASCRFYE